MPYREKQSSLARLLAEDLVRDVIPEELLVALTRAEYDLDMYVLLAPYIAGSVPVNSATYWHLQSQVKTGDPLSVVFVEICYIRQSSLVAPAP